MLFFWRVLTYHQPIVDLRAFTNRNFALGSFFTFLVGTGMYSTTYLIPLFLAQVRGFSALQIGETVFVAGIAQMAMSPFSTQIARRIDLRHYAGDGPRPVCLFDVPDRRPHQSGELSRAHGAAGGARRLADAVLPPGQYDRARLGPAQTS